MKKTIIITVIALLTAVTTQAQIKYTYDASGNRIKREHILKSATIEKNSIQDLREDAEVYVKLFPNPTRGNIYVEFSKMPPGDVPVLEIWGPTGSLIAKKRASGKRTSINLSGKAGGIYVIKTSINQKTQSWKIIKE